MHNRAVARPFRRTREGAAIERTRWLVPFCLLGWSVACAPPEPEAPPLPREPWVDRPVAAWPDFALSNDVVYHDTVFSMLANAFFVDTGADTVGVTCRHIFMVFQNRRGSSTIALDDDFVGWSLRSSRDSSRVVPLGRLINEDSREPIGDFAGIKARDWLLFEPVGWSDGVYPLKVRYSPLEVADTIRAAGRSLTGRYDRDPTLRPLRVFRVQENYYYVQPLDPAQDPGHTSGSPVIDENGHLVLIAGVRYLQDQFDPYGIPYQMR